MQQHSVSRGLQGRCCHTVPVSQGREKAHLRCRTVQSPLWKSGKAASGKLVKQKAICTRMYVHPLFTYISFVRTTLSQCVDLHMQFDCFLLFITCSLQCVANAFSVFGCQHMLDIGFVDACVHTIFPSTAGLDCWKMRGVIRIPPTLNIVYNNYIPMLALC